jgi:hypothetical protein
MTTGRSRQTGNLLVPVMLMGLISALLMGAFINYSVFLEQAAIENQLAETRAYWAVMGHFRYAISRQRYAALCPDSAGCAPNTNIKDTDKVTVLQSYLDEISSYRTFTYAEENSAYSIKIAVTASADTDPTRHTYSGYMTMIGSYPTAGVSTLPVLSGLAQRFAPLQIRLCTSLVSAFAACGGVANNNNGGVPTGYYSVRRLFRTQSAS